MKKIIKWETIDKQLKIRHVQCIYCGNEWGELKGFDKSINQKFDEDRSCACNKNQPLQ